MKIFRSPRFSALLLLAAALGIGAVAWYQASHPSVVVEWSTATELNTAGFNLYRSETPDGPFKKISESLIPAAPDPLTGGDYSYQDENVKPGVTYYYSLEEVETSGNVNTLDVVSAKAARGGILEGAIVLLLLGGAVFFWRVPQARFESKIPDRQSNS